ncbi:MULTISPECIES: type I-C CRISPR-associated protein Cas7/Csd2 [unclassified Methylobacterium]|uniref:type I-C CRISPR-associated protein Cas7/Csd2 n=1 Tax=unclassified Methylobacterium TaxID=2615210 RepID=UPI00226AAABF|nr:MULTISPECIES: type I-C CRISPR-associated protein Cas7/Csd2 [unclassified Methylobacterium]
MAKTADTAAVSAIEGVRRTDICILFDISNGNPNGDPDRGNAPRRNPITGQGLVTGVCLKRKIRDRIAERYEGQPGMEIFITRDAVLGEKKAETIKGKADPNTAIQERFYDVRAFGAVLRANKSEESRADNVNGPVQVSYAQTIDEIQVSEPAITRCASENRREREGRELDNKTFGAQPMLHYGLYRAHIFVDPIKARKTGFSSDDFAALKDALLNLFEGDRAGMRNTMCVRAVYAFEHVSAYGTPGANGLELLEAVAVERKSNTPATSYADYNIYLPENLPEGVTMQVWKAPQSFGRKLAA